MKTVTDQEKRTPSAPQRHNDSLLATTSSKAASVACELYINGIIQHAFFGLVSFMQCYDHEFHPHFCM